MFTEGLAHFICSTNYEDIPAEVITNAKSAILDYLAVAMAGSQEPSGRMIGELVREYQSAPEATVIGNRFKASCALAALANGTSSHVQDYDDCLDYSDAGLAHPTTGTFSGILTVGEKNHLSGRDLLTAYCLGVEAYGTDQAWLRLQKYMYDFKTVAVVYTMIPTHVNRNMNYDRRLLFPGIRMEGTKPLFGLRRDGSVYLKRSPVRLEDYSCMRLWALVQRFWLRWGPQPRLELSGALINAMGQEVEAAGAAFIVVYWSFKSIIRL